eukprot:GHUV01041658.1.p2 GENE.GHUV01041658.1~~GHUV01041658.1.p2  ORF type:complete len:102 (+),score=21.41 GHUV01041658.1:493-798(+)
MATAGVGPPDNTHMPGQTQLSCSDVDATDATEQNSVYGAPVHANILTVHPTLQTLRMHMLHCANALLQSKQTGLHLVLPSGMLNNTAGLSAEPPYGTSTMK